MVSYKNEVEDWSAFAEDEHSLEQYIEKFTIRLNREQIPSKVKEIMLREYIKDVGQNMGYKVI
jgi:hypothetical protein